VTTADRRPDPSPVAPAVEMDLALRMLPGRRFVPAVLRWDPTDPWAATLEFTDINNTWTFGWELLVAAVATNSLRPAQVGEGDVRIRRATGADFEVALSSPAGTALLRVDAFDLAAFVTAVRPRQATAVAAVEWPDNVWDFLALAGDASPRTGGMLPMTNPLDELQHHLEQCCYEYLAQVNGPGRWVVYPKLSGPVGDDRHYDVDETVTEGPVVLVRRSDGARVNVDVSVAVWKAP
jgi:hypothetical protein